MICSAGCNQRHRICGPIWRALLKWPLDEGLPAAGEDRAASPQEVQELAEAW